MNMKRMIATVVMAVVAGMATSAMAEIVRTVPPSVAVESVQFRQRYPWNGMVDIDCKVTCSDVNTNLALYVAAWDNVKDRALTVKTVWIDGDETKNPDLTAKSGAVRIVWDARADNPNEVSDNVSVSVQAYVRDMRYLVIDLSGGSNATEYACSYRAEPPKGGWTDEFKTEKLVLRLIPAGMFTMGSPETETGHNCGYECVETQHRVAITKPFYIGVFEVTQKQYELVKGVNPSQYKGNARPVEYLCYNDIRGSGNGSHWPDDSLVDCDTFLGLVRAKTGRMIDLPTEAQWEYACRAGTTTAFNNGKDVYDEYTGMDSVFELGRYGANCNDGKGGYSQHTTVGSYKPNAWGLYDMHGNVAEWCCDWVAADLGAEGVEDPVGPTSGKAKQLYFCYESSSSVSGTKYSGNYYKFRIARGGCWSVGDAIRLRSAWRDIFTNGRARFKPGSTTSYLMYDPWNSSNYYVLTCPSGTFSNSTDPKFRSSYWGFRVIAMPDGEMAAAIGGF